MNLVETKDTGDRTWDLLHQRADPHQLSYTCNFLLVLFLFPPLSNGKGLLLNKLMIGKGPPSTVGDVHELFCFIRKAFPPTVRGFLLWLGISFYSKGFHSIVRELFLQKGIPLNAFLISKGFLCIVREGFPSIIRVFLIQ